MKEFLSIRDISYEDLKTISNEDLYAIIFEDKNNSATDNNTSSDQESE
jgi:hypothetical protein